jgi:hypothetical protein
VKLVVGEGQVDVHCVVAVECCLYSCLSFSTTCACVVQIACIKCL